MSNKKRLLRLGVSFLCVLLTAFVLTGAVNMGLDYYSKGTSATLRVQNEFTQKKAEIHELISSLEGEGAEEAKKYYEALAKREKLVSEENFYRLYKSNKDYHYYGKYYELFNDVHGADTLILGSSRAVYGVSPAVLEQNSDLDGYSFYNYAFNGARPSYFREWYNIYKNEGGNPPPKTVIYCVDWFMFDTNWMWRDMTGTDATNGGALQVLRQLSGNSQGNTVTPPKQTEAITENIDGTEAVTEEKDDKKEEKLTFASFITKLWNGDLNKIEEFGESVTGKLPLFYARDDIPQMLSYVFSGKGISDSKAANELRATLENELAELYSEYEKLLSGEGGTEYPEVTFPKYNHSFTVDGDGNITSTYYKGWLAWEFDYAGGAGGNGPQFQEREPDRISYSADNTPTHILSEIHQLRLLIKTLQNDGVNVIFVQLPDYNGGGVGSRNDASITEHTAVIAEIAEKYNIPFINYDTSDNSRGESIANHKKYYSNWNHLNGDGAVAFTKLLAEDLAELLNKK